MSKLDLSKRAQVLGLLIEVPRINATCRITGIANVTVLELLADLGMACAFIKRCM